MYELGLKHCGEQVSFKISVEKLFEKSGSVGDIRNFRRDLRELTEENSLPDYHFVMMKMKKWFTIFRVMLKTL